MAAVLAVEEEVLAAASAGGLAAAFSAVVAEAHPVAVMMVFPEEAAVLTAADLRMISDAATH